MCRQIVEHSFTTYFIFLLAMLLFVTSVDASQIYNKRGYVLARGQILGENGQPILVEVDEQGEEIQDIGELFGPLEGVFTQSALKYQTLVDNYNTFKTTHEEGIARGAVPVSTVREDGTSEYESYCAGLPKINVPAATPDDEPTEKAIPCPPVTNSAIRSVLLRHPSTIIDPDFLGEDGPILFQSPLDLRNILDLGDLNDPDFPYKTVLLTPTGAIAKQANGDGIYKNNITFKWEYFQPDENEDAPDRYQFNELVDERVLSPIAGAKVYQGLSPLISTRSGKQGDYKISYYLTPCPCTTRFNDGLMIAEIPYTNFNPKAKGRASFGTYAVSTATSDVCNGLAECPYLPSYVQSEVTAIIATLASPASQRSDLKVDAVVLTGEGRLDVPVDTTAYDTERATFDTQNPADTNLHYDFDGDRQPDQAVLHNGQYYVYLGGREPEYDEETPDQPINEDLLRRPDSLPDFEDRGLLKSISLEDLEQTDIYVYRVSTGQLILERIGLKSEEYVPYNGGGADDDTTDSGNFYYKFLVRGPRNVADLVTGGLSDWWSKADVKLELFENNKTDFLRTGEQVQIIAINRPTGYIGSVIAPLQLKQQGLIPTTIDVPIDQIKLGPPNLKIRAERNTKTELGLTKDEINDYLIGSEGAGLKSDTYIKVTTEWFDEDGSPLPSDLPGYSALLAKVTGPGQLGQDNACSSQLNTIEIQPGAKLQLLKLNDGCDLQNDHYYLYVCGHNLESDGKDQCFNFEGEGGRPTNYVPIKVPLYDELATRQQENTYRYAKQDGLLTDEQLEQTPDPIYQWVYRPEMQFSVYELTQDTLKLSYKDETDQIQVIDLVDVDKSTFNEILNSASYLEILFDLQGNTNDPLQNFGPTRELSFVFGEEEMQAKIGADGVVRFVNLDHLVDLVPEDFLNIRLHMNDDTANILWEYAFDLIDLDSDSDNNNGFNRPSRSNTEERLEGIVNISNPGKLLVVNRRDSDRDGLPGFADMTERTRFIPILLEYAEAKEDSEAQFIFSYSASDPASITTSTNQDGDIIYLPGPGKIRLWKKNANQIRNPLGVKHGGDFVRPETPYTLEELGGINTLDELMLYMEGINPSDSAGDVLVKVTLQKNVED